MLDPQSFESLMDSAIKELRRLGPLIRINAKDVLVLGDLHGDLDTLNNIVSNYGAGRPRYIALGDYVDRGERQIETLYRILELFMDGSLIPLRGNHESRLTSFDYGFADEALHYLGNELFKRVLDELFPSFPYAAVLNDNFFLVHGGIPNPVPKVSELEKLPQLDKDPINPIAFQLLWNDPAEISGYAQNPRGPGIYLFGRDVTERFLQLNSLTAVIRGHEFFTEGYHIYHGVKVISIFTSRGGIYSASRPKILSVAGDEMEVIDVESRKSIIKIMPGTSEKPLEMKKND